MIQFMFDCKILLLMVTWDLNWNLITRNRDATFLLVVFQVYGCIIIDLCVCVKSTQLLFTSTLPDPRWVLRSIFTHSRLCAKEPCCHSNAEAVGWHLRNPPVEAFDKRGQRGRVQLHHQHSELWATAERAAGLELECTFKTKKAGKRHKIGKSIKTKQSANDSIPKFILIHFMKLILIHFHLIMSKIFSFSLFSCADLLLS